MCACYLIHSKGLSADEAIAEIRRLRPGSIDTEKQINSVKMFAQDVQGKKLALCDIGLPSSIVFLTSADCLS
jgi:hypothetical protein